MNTHKVIGYCRVSTAKQDKDTDTLFNQQLIIDQYAKSKELPYEVFSEQRSGSLPPQHRSILSQALNALSPGDIFFVKSRDRLSRDPIITNYIIGIITLEKKASLVCGDDVETQDFITRLCHNFVSDIAAHQYRESISKKVIATIEMRKRQLKQWGTYVPYGFVVDDDKNLYISSKQQEVLDEMKTMKSLNINAGKIAKTLNDRGIPRPRYINTSKGSWSRNSVERVLSRDYTDLKRQIIVKYGDEAVKDVDLSATMVNTTTPVS